MWKGEVGGAERAVFQLALHQQRDGRRRVAIAYGQGTGYWHDQAREAGIPVIDLEMRHAGDVVALARSFRRLRAARIHHFHSLEVPLMYASTLVPGAARIYTHRGGYMQYTGRRALRYRLAGPILRRRFTITGNTAHAAASARLLWALPADEVIAVTYNAMDLSLLEPRVDRHAVRSSAGVSGDTVVLGTAANLRDWKRIDWLIDAAAQLRGDWLIWIIGDGPAEARLRRLAAASPAASRIRFLGRQHDMGSWLHAMDVFTLPSNQLESFGNAAVEAMACGLPVVVAADSPGLAEHVRDGETGFIIDDPRGLAARLQALVDDPELRLRAAAAGAAHVRSAYTTERAVERYEAVYRRLTGG